MKQVLEGVVINHLQMQKPAEEGIEPFSAGDAQPIAANAAAVQVLTADETILKHA